MKIINAILSVFLVSFLSFADEPKTTFDVAGTPAATEEAFTGEQLTLKKQMDALFEASKKVNGPEKAKARAVIEGALNWDKIARDCLGASNIAKTSAANFSAFKNLLKDVVVKTAYSRMDKFWDGSTVKFDKIEVKGKEGHVSVTFTAKEEGFKLDYYYSKKGNTWMIDDVAFDELRYSTSINEQIDAFLKEKSFSALLDKLKKRKQDLDTPKTEKKSG